MARTSFELEVRHRETETGVWCPECFLPSALRFTFDLVSATSGVRMAEWSGEACVDCEWTSWEDEA